MDAYLAYNYLMGGFSAEKSDSSSFEDTPLESLRRTLQSCTVCGAGSCAPLKYDCGSYCSSIPCDTYNNVYNAYLGVYIGVIVAVVLLLICFSVGIYFWSKGNAKRRVLVGPMGGVMDEGTELCIVIILGIVFGGLLGTLFFLCAMFCGRNKGTAEGQALAAAGGGGAPVVQGYVVAQPKV